jgi:hypothetical protein
MFNLCPTVEGQSIRDVSIVCNGSTKVDCSAFVLIADGPKIVECSLPFKHDGSGEARSRHTLNLEDVWSISSSWLHEQHHEEVASLAIDNECLRHQRHTVVAKRASCIVFGTAAATKDEGYGRIVQMKGSLAHEHELVPQRTIHVRNVRVGPGALHVTDTGYVVALSTRRNAKHRKRTQTVMEAFHKDTGEVVGTWSMPKDVDWLTLSGGGDFLLILGLRQKPWGFELWRFNLPPQMRV